MAWYCYVNSLRKNIVSKSLNVEELDPRDENDKVTQVEELILVVLDDQLPYWVIYIRSLLNPEVYEGLI